MDRAQILAKLELKKQCEIDKEDFSSSIVESSGKRLIQDVSFKKAARRYNVIKKGKTTKKRNEAVTNL